MNDLFEKSENKKFNKYKRHLTELIISNEKRFIVTANLEALVLAFDDKSFYYALSG